MDAQVLAERAAGRPWWAIAVSMGLGRNTVIERCRELGIAPNRPTKLVLQPQQERLPTALPPGDPITWGLLLALTPSLSAA